MSLKRRADQLSGEGPSMGDVSEILEHLRRIEQVANHRAEQVELWRERWMALQQKNKQQANQVRIWLFFSPIMSLSLFGLFTNHVTEFVWHDTVFVHRSPLCNSKWQALWMPGRGWPSCYPVPTATPIMTTKALLNHCQHGRLPLPLQRPLPLCQFPHRHFPFPLPRNTWYRSRRT